MIIEPYSWQGAIVIFVQLQILAFNDSRKSKITNFNALYLLHIIWLVNEL